MNVMWTARSVAKRKVFPVAMVTTAALAVGIGMASPAVGSAGGSNQVRPAAPGSRLWVSRYQGAGGDIVATSAAVSPAGSTVFVAAAARGLGDLGTSTTPRSPTTP